MTDDDTDKTVSVSLEQLEEKVEELENREETAPTVDLTLGGAGLFGP
ncbi:hypothetical protein [Haloferax larsenii]|uniref:Uncharacterized protein n=1 Tax=Haloferax larsenii TaxID=302484 RepID=A0A1H7QPW8_HALLR|nr:hypothetical protein [Haloferax larsenii]SEL49962.1 hypothetical protein SAMN04488691_105112 [Haloferax larsenii]